MVTASYTLDSYGRKPVFSSFLPGVAGERGIPLWCFYVNRGQCVAGFGSRDKNHSIMEFSPANAAYQRVRTLGFRTFVKIDGRVVEPFQDGLGEMQIGENDLCIRWESRENQLKAEVRYFLVPGMKLGMLARRVTLESTSESPRSMEVLDGLSAIVPFGVDQHALKMMGQTAKAWMMVEGVETSLPYFRLRSSLGDTTSVEPIEDGSFGAAAADGTLLRPIVDPEAVFAWDTSFETPVGFAGRELSSLLAHPQRTENDLPCCFFAWQGTMEKPLRIDSVYGLSHGLRAFHPAVQELLLQGGLDEREAQARELLAPYVDVIRTQTADPLFDAYCRQSYIDNFLRGGVAHLFRSGEQSRLFYLFSRKHGDLERDYNDFVVTPEYASQGNGNFRDVLQNRRTDVRFCPDAGWEPLKPFLELIQSNGYNPLVIQPVTYVLEDSSAFDPRLADLLSAPFTPGSLLMELEKLGLDALLADTILCAARPEVNAAFGEGYWIDHWIYLLDLLESYLSIYPDQKKKMLGERCLRWYAARAEVLPLSARCVESHGGLRQHNALIPTGAEGWLKDAEGHTVLSTPLEKLFMLCVLKFASLDQSGEAVSMEAGKPGWYDALNGLPGLFGSSTAESFELWRLLVFVRDVLEDEERSLHLPEEMLELAREAHQASSLTDSFARWQRMTAALEAYRARPVGPMGKLGAEYAYEMIASLEDCLSASLCALVQRTSGDLPTYFINLPTAWQAEDGGLRPTAFDHRPLPPFLEGPMHALRLPLDRQTKLAITEHVRRGPLYDQKLRMYKVSADLTHETPELGRANGFTRGWLEHESIWLHMEYKYLLELLKNGFYDRFLEDFENALIPFQPPERYGRSVLENCSFLASSANPDPGTHGRGFVARLSGATAEFLEMWQLLFFGKTPFHMEENGLTFSLCPTLPARLIPAECSVSAMFLGQIPVTYHLPAQENITPATHRAAAYRLTIDGVVHSVNADLLSGEYAQAIRSGRCASMDVTIERL